MSFQFHVCFSWAEALDPILGTVGFQEILMLNFKPPLGHTSSWPPPQVSLSEASSLALLLSPAEEQVTLPVTLRVSTITFPILGALVAALCTPNTSSR